MFAFRSLTLICQESKLSFLSSFGLDIFVSNFKRRQALEKQNKKQIFLHHLSLNYKLSVDFTAVHKNTYICLLMYF